MCGGGLAKERIRSSKLFVMEEECSNPELCAEEGAEGRQTLSAGSTGAARRAPPKLLDTALSDDSSMPSTTSESEQHEAQQEGRAEFAAEPASEVSSDLDTSSSLSSTSSDSNSELTTDSAVPSPVFSIYSTLSNLMDKKLSMVSHASLGSLSEGTRT